MAVTKQQHKRYEPQEFEAKWQNRWEDAGIYRAEDFGEKPKYYLLDFFPYPSGDGLSVGHSKHYIPTDVATRFLRMSGYNVLHPMGWDAFGLPAENEAILRQVQPAENTAKNVANYKRQLGLQGISFDWSREINSAMPDYYGWDQWFFLLLYDRGLAYRATGMQWWCPQCKTILANEQVENGYCWRHSDQLVEKKELEQWYFKITDYAEELLRDLDTLDWPERILLMQRHWIGRSEGAEIVFTAADPAGGEHPIRVFTTRPDTVFGATFMVLSPEHPLVDLLTTPEHRARVVQYRQEASRQSEIERLSTEREKAGVPTGAHAVNPLTGERVPVWIADYVLMSYGTGAIMAVPAHDERDFEFARKYSLQVRQVVRSIDVESDDGAFSGEGIMVNSGDFSGLTTEEGKRKVIEHLEQNGIGHGTVAYRMRDWLVSRQRYWGAPIPIVYCDACGIVPVPREDLPVLLPRLEKYEPGDDGRSPLATDPEFVNTTCPACGGPARRETDTLDGFVDSSWYFLRFTSPRDTERPFDPEKVRYWCPIDLYVGGAEHAVMHLLYFRFFTKVMADAGLIQFREPALRLRNQGVMHAPDGRRMSKSKRNVITPDSVAAEYGADTLRGYILFIGPFEGDAVWDPHGINGVHRWLARVWDIGQPSDMPVRHQEQPDAEDVQRAVHKAIAKVGADLAGFQFNTAVSTLMELTNLMQRERSRLEGSPAWSWAVEQLLRILAPIAPHLTEELWHRRGHSRSIHLESWPEYDDVMTLDEVVTVVIQVNGKLRDRLEVPRGLEPESVREQALASPKVEPYVTGRQIVKIVSVADKLVNIVVR
ncbi:MAG TPA: leucine--tRNA ligase [Chloroflexota bacterium]